MITNTTTQVTNDPGRALIQHLAGGIEASEARGQAELLASDRLPARSDGDDPALIALGFTFGEPDADDPLFRPATLPLGWKRQGSEHALWSYLIDERGIRRVSLGYKAAFYDRWARMSLVNVGDDTAGQALYANEAPTSDTLKIALLTDAERGEFDRTLDGMRENIRTHPKIYGRYAANLKAIDAIIAAK